MPTLENEFLSLGDEGKGLVEYFLVDATGPLVIEIGNIPEKSDLFRWVGRAGIGDAVREQLKRVAPCQQKQVENDYRLQKIRFKHCHHRYFTHIHNVRPTAWPHRQKVRPRNI